MARKNVTIRELRQAAKVRWGLRSRSIDVIVYRRSPDGVTWQVTVEPTMGALDYITIGNDSRQGAMRMALAALRAK